MNPASGPVPASNIEIRFERGTSMPGRAWCASDPRALIAIVHGLGEHSGRYAALAGDLVRARFTVVALDLPGHGEARGPRGDIPSWTRVRDQIVPLLFTASRGLPGQPLKLPHVLLGHGMGGVMALDYALAHPREILADITNCAGRLVVGVFAVAAIGLGLRTGTRRFVELEHDEHRVHLHHLTDHAASLEDAAGSHGPELDHAPPRVNRRAAER